MNFTDKPIRLSQHAKEQSKYRGCTEEEITQTIRSAKWEKAKQVKPIFIEEKDEIIVVTAYVYYF